ncbi:MAG TPA: hypothetical protein VFA50_21865 [Stellaceae bacterium]|nr:hypothetical protein [Stellaceae bacterium]
MLRTASSLALLLLMGLPATAFAADCLQQIDGLVVEYDLPASDLMAGSQTAGLSVPKLPPTPPPGSFTATPAGRPGMHAAPHGSSGALADFPKLPPRHPLTADQKTRLLEKLHEARATEALGNEAQCFDRLHEAQAIVGQHG